MERWKVKERRVLLLLLFLVSVSLSLLSFPSQPKHLTSLAVLNLAIPSPQIPLPLQLVLANCWQLQFSSKAVCYPWWNFGCFGVTFLTEPDKMEDLKESILQMWKQPNWDLLIFRQGKNLASQQLSQWKRMPMEWLKWQARITALGNRSSLDEDELFPISFDDFQIVARKLARYDPLLIFPNGYSQSFTNLPLKRPSLYTGFHLTFKTTSLRTHGLWWLVAKGEPEAAIVLGNLLGGGTEAKWFQILRGEKPIAYHAIAQVLWTPFGVELSLYAATAHKDFKIAQKKARQLLSDLMRGEIGEGEFERAKLLAQLRLKQIEADPIALNQELAVWAMSGKSFEDWEKLPLKLQSLSLKDLKAFCLSLPRFSELIAMP